MPALFLIPPLLYLGLYKFLDASGPVSMIFLIELPLLLSYLESSHKGFLNIRLWGKGSRISLYFILFLSFLIFILLIPENHYHAWLILLADGRPAGSISFAFVYAAGIVSSYGCSSLILNPNKTQALLNLLLLINMVLIILYPSTGLFLPFLLLIALKLNFSIVGKGPLKRIYAVMFLLIPALFFAFLIPVLQEEPRGSHFIDGTSRNIQKGLSFLFPDLPLFLQIPGYGYSYESSRKTGEKPLLSPKIIFTISGEPSSLLYLKTDVFYAYREGLWIYENLSIPEKIESLPGSLSFQRVEVTVETDIYTRLPLHTWTEYVQYKGQFYSVDRSLASLPPDEFPLTKGDSFILYNRYHSGNPQTEEMVEREKQRAMNVPDSLKNDLESLSQSLKGKDNKETLMNIHSYLSEHYTYSLDTESSDKMVQKFLFGTYSGYCVHFSTAAAFLARIMGVPVRIAEGFLILVPSEDDSLQRQGAYEGTVSITGYSAHQWPEIYLDEWGWVPWEVTPPFTGLQDTLSTGTIGFDAMTQSQLEHMGFRNSVDDLENSTFLWDKKMLGSTGMTLLILLVFILIPVSYYRFQNRFSDHEIHKALRIITKKMNKKWGISSPVQGGWIQWFQGLPATARTGVPHHEDVLRLLLIFKYGENALNPSERKRLMRGCHQIRLFLSKSRTGKAEKRKRIFQKKGPECYNELGD
ncbi:transglutaminase-like domain-containing protein [Oceanispirochaeta sp.]|jgi:hypothetical protein|uniref:transglutaminase-like domain-containing protein n=1 Tax=Oceanispirochaeta sp. TaxID=2035350 RepID=UPI002627E2C0|nr:transglutaminase-like domain-containing protein [Oceanispirochaeta sp.]MDA3958681.1 transglutaminase-like domain-containing protein [Oceanispirochaeta sp.]